MALTMTLALARAQRSLHAYFLLPGDPNAPFVYTVHRLRDGRSFATRHVTAQVRTHARTRKTQKRRKRLSDASRLHARAATRAACF